MQQRRLRLGDVLDDYCPRERRVTNHVVVAMIDDDVKQTRCSTCDADHDYKEARVPAARRKKEGGALANEVAEDASRVRRPDVVETLEVPEAPPAEEVPLEVAADVQLENEDPPVPSVDDDGPVHRPLIRATFPRPEGQVPERREPDFTVRQQGGRPGGREIDGNRPQGQKRNRRPHRGGSGRSGDTRFGGPSQGNGPRGGGGGQSNRGGPSPHGQGGSNQPGDNRGNGRPAGGEGRFRRRRGR